MNPIWATSIWHSTPGSLSKARIVVSLGRNPHRWTANRCNVRYRTLTPRRVSNCSTLTMLSLFWADPGADLLLMGQQHLPRVAVTIGTGRAHRADHDTDQLIVQSLQSAAAGQPRLLGGLHVPAGSLAVHPGRAATVRSPTPSNQPRRTSRTSTTSTSLNTTAVDLHVDEHDVRSQQPSRGLNPHDALCGPITGNQVVP